MHIEREGHDLEGHFDVSELPVLKEDVWRDSGHVLSGSMYRDGTYYFLFVTLDESDGVHLAELCEDLDDLEAANTPPDGINAATMWVAVARENLPSINSGCATDRHISLFFINHDAEGENFNAFIAAGDGERASAIWVEWMRHEWGRTDVDLKPQRVFLFRDSQVAGPERVIPWHSDELRQIAGTQD